MTHSPLPPFAAWSGPRDARTVFVGEAWGRSEFLARKPLVGESGKEFWRMLGEAMPDIAPDAHRAASAMMQYDLAWVPYRDEFMREASIAFTNVLAFRPPDNKLEPLCGTKAEVGGKLPPIERGKYLRPEFLPELDRLFVELCECNPNVVVALGNTACWALLQATNIGSIRGNVTSSVRLGPPPVEHLKVLPTYHPAGVLRQWSWRPIVVADLMKARREAAFAEIRRPKRSVLINPSLGELLAWVDETLTRKPPLLANDIETGQYQIKCMSFARSRSEAIVVPFVDLGHPSGSYWSTASDELAAWRACKALLESDIPKLYQNGMYDLQYITRMGIRPAACTEDTMLLHHSIFPELQKGLGFLGSIYTDEQSWKLMRRPKADTEKRDE